jgi:hypothetical protein
LLDGATAPAVPACVPSTLPGRTPADCALGAACLQVDVTCLDCAAPPGHLRVLALLPGSATPLMTARVRLPACEPEEG